MNPSGGDSSPGPGRVSAFPSTHWSVVLAARSDDSAQAQRALNTLCRAYWYPLYAYVRRRGNNPTEAEDLTQSFFARLIEKDFLGQMTPGTGRFRSFLLAALKHFLANEWDRSQAGKRGGGREFISLDDDQLEHRYRLEPVDAVTPESVFERRWALAVLEQVLTRLRAEFVAAEKRELFDELKPFLSADGSGESYADVATRTGLKPGTVKVAVHRLRRRYGELLKAEIANTVSDPAEIAEELRHLISVLSG